ncbi:MAG: hypothetical protein FJW30_28005 [Acidobacteria bacterium]|nr:hypothetical protein [Acidobacteriota bacterium]
MNKKAAPKKKAAAKKGAAAATKAKAKTGKLSAAAKPKPAKKPKISRGDTSHDSFRVRKGGWALLVKGAGGYRVSKEGKGKAPETSHDDERFPGGGILPMTSHDGDFIGIGAGTDSVNVSIDNEGNLLLRFES